VNDGQWFCETNEECKGIAQNESYLILPVIGYIDKTAQLLRFFLSIKKETLYQVHLNIRQDHGMIG